MPDKKPSPLLGRLAVHHGMLSADQVAECTREQSRLANPPNLGTLFVQKGYLTREQLQRLLKIQKRLVEQHRARKEEAAGAQAPLPRTAPQASAPSAGASAPAVGTSVPAASEPAPAAALPAPAAAVAAAPKAETGSQIPHDGAPLEALLRQGLEARASDIHVHADAPPRLRCNGRLVEIAGPALDAATTERILVGALGEADRRLLDERGELDLCHEVPGLARFRANVYRQQRGLDGVFRVIPAAPPTLEELGLPRDLARFTNYHQGLVLVTGPTGSGKSSTLAALVGLLNEERREHVLCIEDPIEHQHVSRKSLMNQRSVERHTESFPRALRAALREDPDVLVIGELRDLETISLALSAAETGHFVLGTMHTGGAIRTINRLVGSFPSNQQGQIRTMLSESLRAVVSQLLLPRADGAGRVAALETLVVTRAVGNLIRENKTFQIHSILQTGAAQGMRLLDQSLRELVAAGTISREEALRHCEDAKALGAA